MKSAAKTIEEKALRKLAVLNRSVDHKAFTKSERFDSFRSPARQPEAFADSEEVNGLLIDAIRAKLALLSKL